MTSVGISVTDRDGVRSVVLDRTDKKNALTVAMYAVLAQALETAAVDGIGAVLITARGTAFTAGNDLHDFLDQTPRGEDTPSYTTMRPSGRSGRDGTQSSAKDPAHRSV